MSSKKMKSKKLILATTISLVAFSTYSMSIKLLLYGNGGDIDEHIEFAKQMFAGTRKAATPIYYLVWGFFNKILMAPEKYAAAYADAFFSALCALSVYFIVKVFFKDKLDEFQRCLITVFMMFFGPLYFKFFNKLYYLGQGTFNTWHNPTNNSVKFISLIIVFLFVYIFDLDENKKITILNKKYNYRNLLNILNGGLAVLSIWIKPSFFQVFAPTVAIVYLVDLIHNKKKISFYIKNGIVYLPAVGSLIYQIFIQFLSSNRMRSGFIISFFDVLGHYSPNIFISILITITFPIFVLIVCNKNFFEDNYYITSVIFYVVSVIEACTFAEAASKYAGNFLWGMNLGIGVIFMYSILKFINYHMENKNNKKMSVKVSIFMGYTLLSAHFLWGIWYYKQVLTLLAI